MSRLSPARARSIQRLAPAYTPAPEAQKRLETIAAVERERNLGGEVLRSVAVLIQPEDEGGIRRSYQINDRGRYGQSLAVINSARALAGTPAKPALKTASATARGWIERDNGKLTSSKRDAVTARKRAAAAWIAEEAELALELSEVS